MRKGSVKEAVPEAAAQPSVGNDRLDRVAKLPGKACEVAEASRKHGFDLLAHASRQQWRSAAAGDADNDRIAVDNGGYDECRKLDIVDDVDGNPGLSRRFRNPAIDRGIAGRGNDRGAPLDVARAERAPQSAELQ